VDNPRASAKCGVVWLLVVGRVTRVDEEAGTTPSDRVVSKPMTSPDRRPDALDRAIGTWLAAQQPPPPTTPPPAARPRRAVAVDGKTLRGRATTASRSAACRSPPSPAWTSPRRPGDPHHPPRPAAHRPPLAHHDGLRGHQPHRRPGQPRPPGRLDPRPLGHRGAAPPPRCHLRRGRLPGPHRHRPTRHGQPARPRHRHPARPRRPQPRRRPAPQRPRRHRVLPLLGVTSP
jgi:hypothetical protein